MPALLPLRRFFRNSMSRFPARCCVSSMKPLYFATRKLQLLPAATVLIVLAISIPLSAQTITTFDATGAGTAAFQGTYATNINPSGTIIGFSRDANNVRHGFIRSKNGGFTLFDAPGSSTAPGQGTRAYSINPSGTIAGFFTDSVNAFHGYVRSSQGVFTVFDAPGAGTAAFQGTFPFSPLIMNPNGAITGWATDSAFVSHGFLRDRNGNFTTFDVLGAGTGAGQGTFPSRSARMGTSQDFTLTRPMRTTASCGIRRASLPRTTFRARAQVPARYFWRGPYSEWRHYGKLFRREQSKSRFPDG